MAAAHLRRANSIRTTTIWETRRGSRTWFSGKDSTGAGPAAASLP
jgi:hypothetical protein